MYSKSFKKKSPFNRIVVYASMTSVVVFAVTLITMSMLGFRFNGSDLAQNAFLQFSSSPSGATVTVDGKIVGSRTPNKYQLSAGTHEVVMWRDGYEKWSKTVELSPGTLTWLNYALLVPKDLTVESVANYESLFMTLASPKGNDLLVQKHSDVPTFDLVNLGSNAIKSTTVTIPSSVYSESLVTGVAHTFRVDKWDDEGRYVLINHVFNEKNEWIVMDTQNVELTKNITKLFDLSISNLDFLGTSGNIFYALESNDIRKLDLTAGTISKPFVSDVTSFEVYNDSKVITYVGTANDGDNKKRVVGTYRDGDELPSVIKTVDSNNESALAITTSRYFNENYVAVLDDHKIDIYSGSYPDAVGEKVNSMKVVASFDVEKDIDKLSFSPTGEYVFVQSGSYFASYDLEYQTFYSSTIDGNGAVGPLKWLDGNHVWSDRDGKLTIREFDGANYHAINSVVTGQDATLTSNGRYLYSIDKSQAGGYQLQRVRMILR